MAPLDLLGQKFGMLTVVALGGHKRRERAWRCRCDCGRESVVVTGQLRNGGTKSCGCRKRAVLGESTTTHGGCKTRTYRIWAGMRQRCNNPKHHAYYRYGGRGIKVCPEWVRFAQFRADMGEAPSGLTIERINNEQGYSKGNCRWATPFEQGHNMRTNRHVTFRGETMILTDWARRFGTDPSTLRKQWIRQGVIVL